MHINCYYEDLGSADHSEAVELWKKCWEKNGWVAHVHGPSEIEWARVFSSGNDVVNFREFMTRAAAWPTRNPQSYEMACWRRWLVAAAVGGAWCDYDVLPVNFPPSSPNFHCAWTIDTLPSCGVVWGSPSDFRKFLAFAYETPPIMDDHHSDMYAWQAYAYAQRLPLIMRKGIWFREGYDPFLHPLSAFVHVPHLAGNKWNKLRELADYILKS